MLLDGAQYVDEFDFSGQSVPVKYVGSAIGPVPAVQLDATTPHSQTARVRFHGRFRGKLIPGQVTLKTEKVKLLITVTTLISRGFDPLIQTDRAN